MEGGALNVSPDAFADLAGCAVGEAEAEHAVRQNAALNGGGSASGEGHGLAGANRGHDEDGLLPLVDDGLLEGVEPHPKRISID